MKAVKSKGNKSTELTLLKYFKENSINGWRRNYDLFGKPDIVFPKSKIAIFLDGCFWHGHDCRNVTPKTNASYWSKKIMKNKSRDQLVEVSLELKGWRIIRIWECKINSFDFNSIKSLV